MHCRYLCFLVLIFSFLAITACSNLPGNTDIPGATEDSGGADGDSPITESPAPIPEASPPIDIGNGIIKSLSSGLPEGLRNAAERKAFPHYLGSLKALDGNHIKQLPIRTYFASCMTDTAEPRMFISMTLEDTSATADPDIPTIGSVMEAIYNPGTKTLQRTGNETTIPLCQETHGIAVSSDCSTVAVLCNTDFEKPVSETESFTRDLIAEHGDSWMIQPNNEAAVNAKNPGLSQEELEKKYKYNGEMWLLEWDDKAITSEPDRYVIHKAVGGHQLGASTLVYAEDQDTYGAAFTTAVFDPNGGRHRSAALLVIDRNTWTLNPEDPDNNNRERGWSWDCVNGHVLHIRTFFNPFAGHFGALCTTDNAKYWSASSKGAIGVKMETRSSLFGGPESHLVASHSAGVTNGAGHKLIAVDEEKSIIVIAATNMVSEDNSDLQAFIVEAEEAASARGLPYTGLDACSWWWDDICLRAFLDENDDHGTFRGGFWNDPLSQNELTKIGLLTVSATGSSRVDGIYRSVKWVVEDDDCMLGAPQLVDLKNGRYLLGYAKFQCLSDDIKLKRFAGKHTLHPKAYYIMEIDAEGNALTEPVQLEGTGWGGQDDMVSLGEGRAAWAYIPNPEIHADGSFADPYQSNWELMVYESPLD